MQQKELNSAYNSIKQVLETARNNTYRAINFEMVLAYWSIGKIIVEQEQKGKNRADYGKYLINELSKRLTQDYGKGFNKSNLWYIRAFFLNFKKLHALRGELTWTRYRLLLGIENHQARNFYIIESINNRWSTRELERQINSLLYERFSSPKNI